jgi:predicted SAM-dependent methyltransferase
MVKLHLGCGKRDFGSDWIHIDGGTFPHVTHNDITKLSFEDESVDLIYASHVLEYFDRDEVIPVLEEWYRVLKVGGKLRLAVPDFEEMAFLYAEGKYPLESFLGPLYGKMKMDDVTIYHKTTYDIHSLSRVLRNDRQFTSLYFSTHGSGYGKDFHYINKVDNLNDDEVFVYPDLLIKNNLL